MTITRRQFLQFAGIALAASRVAPLSLPAAADTVYGRALEALAVYPTADLSAAPVSHLWPDSITPILDSSDHWYRLPAGFVRRAAIQPMKPCTPPSAGPAPAPPFWAEVAGPAAPIRQFCAANAPLITRIGHGGTAHIVDALPGDPLWYAAADDTGALLGWTQAVHWRPLALNPPPPATAALRIEIQTGRLIALEDGQTVLEAACSLNPTVQRGQSTVSGRAPGAAALADGTAYHGAPWCLYLDGLEIVGAYWHNRFGAAMPGPAVQVSPLLAEWLYNRLSDGAPVVFA